MGPGLLLGETPPHGCAWFFRLEALLQLLSSVAREGVVTSSRPGPPLAEGEPLERLEKVALALAAGNALIVKSSELAPVAPLELGR
jgi:hypothetical protein